MTPRPRTVDDAEILAATARVIGRVGPAKLTLSLVGKEVGLAPATLVQRFGSKRGMLLALGRSAKEDTPSLAEELQRKHGSPLKALREYLLLFTKMAKTPEEMANHLSAFQMDLVDPELRNLTLEICTQQEVDTTSLLRAAVQSRELRGLEPTELAPVLLTVTQGSLLSWALYRKGSARRWVARHLDTTLKPYLNTRPRRKTTES